VDWYIRVVKAFVGRGYFVKVRMVNVLIVVCALNVALLSTVYAGSRYGKTVNIAIVTDGASENAEKHRELLQAEIRGLLEGEYSVNFLSGKGYEGGWALKTIQKVFSVAEDNDNIDIVIAHGLVASHVAINTMNLKKPTIATLFLDSDIQSVPKKGKTSGRHNLTYIQHEKTFLKDIQLYREVAPFKTLAVIGDASMTEIAEFRRMLESAKERVKEDGIEFLFVADSGDVDSILAEIDKVITQNDAVYLLPNERLSQKQLAVLGEELLKRKIPAFAMQDNRVIEYGFLAVYSHENTFRRERRRVALNIKDILDGIPAEELSVHLEIDHQLYINQQTLDALGLDLTWNTLKKAKIVNTGLTSSPHLSLSQMANSALENNLDLKIERRTLAVGQSDVDVARAKRLPQLSLGLQQTMIDNDRATFSNGSNAERDLSASLTLQQVIYNEAAWSNVSAQELLQKSRESDLLTTELDVIEEATLAYINGLRAKSLIEIETSNLRLTEANLKRAKRRVVAGVARKSEIYRWQSQEADNKRSLLNAKSTYENSLLQINQLLNRPLNTPFVIEMIDKQHAIFEFNRKVTSTYLTGPSALVDFANRSEAYAVTHAPELKSINAVIAAQERLLKGVKRQYYVPDITLQATIQEHIDKNGDGDNYPQGVGINDTDASIAVVFTLPLYSGGERYAEVAQQSNAIYKLRYQKASLENGVKQRVRSTFNQLSASYPGIELSGNALVAAKKNYEMVRDSYERGTVSIVDFLDAQNQVFAAERSSANAVYDYLDDYMRYQRSIGYFFYFNDPQGIYSLMFNDSSNASANTGVAP